MLSTIFIFRTLTPSVFATYNILCIHTHFCFIFTVCINNVEVRTVKPGTYKHTITGLTPNTVYNVTVRAKNIKAPPFVDEKCLVCLLEKLSVVIIFPTTVPSFFHQQMAKP